MRHPYRSQDFEDDGASFRVRRDRELRRREMPLIVQGENRVARWLRLSSPVKIFVTIFFGLTVFFFAYFVIGFGALFIYAALTQ